jgi:hypothetical protein
VSKTSVSEGVAKANSPGNQRATIRYHCAPATVGKVFSAADQEFQRAWIIDLSLKGIGMELSRPVELGHHVIISIRGNDGTKVYELSACIMHCNKVPQGETWYVGCELVVPLSPEELDQLL